MLDRSRTTDMTADRNVVGRVNEDYLRLGAVQQPLKRCSLGRISAGQVMLTPFYILSESCDNLRDVSYVPLREIQL